MHLVVTSRIRSRLRSPLPMRILAFKRSVRVISQPKIVAVVITVVAVVKPRLLHLHPMPVPVHQQRIIQRPRRLLPLTTRNLELSQTPVVLRRLVPVRPPRRPSIRLWLTWGRVLARQRYLIVMGQRPPIMEQASLNGRRSQPPAYNGCYLRRMVNVA